jgi:hypothetical protein
VNASCEVGFSFPPFAFSSLQATVSRPSSVSSSVMEPPVWLSGTDRSWPNVSLCGTPETW